MIWQTRPDWWKFWHWLPWHSSSLDKDYAIYSHFGGFGPFQFHWWSSGPCFWNK